MRHIRRYITSFKKIKDLFIIAKGWYKLKIVYVYVVLFVKRIIGQNLVLKNDCLLVFNKYDETIKFLIRRQLDFDVLWDSLCEDQYEINADHEDVLTIMDVGSNIGSTVVNFYYKFKNATIYAFEPDPANFEQLQKNIALLPDPSRVTAFHAAASNVHKGSMTFYIHPKKHWSSSLSRRSDDDTECVVQTVTLDGVCADESIKSIDILKIDIEGAESIALDEFDFLSNVDYVLGEIHPGVMADSVMEFVLRFKDFDMDYFSTDTDVFKFSKKT